MKAQVVIPKGWRRVTTGMYMHEGDRLLERSRMEWVKVSDYWAWGPGDLVSRYQIVIRRVAKPRRKK